MFKADGKNVTIKPGFVLTISSWENDGDAHASESKHFKTLDEAKLFISILKKYAGQFGNLYDDWGDRTDKVDVSKYTDEELYYLLNEAFDDKEDIESLIAKLRAGEDTEEFEDAEDTLMDILRDFAYDVMGGSEHYVCRVLDGYSIHEVKEKIVFNVVEHDSKTYNCNH